MRNVQVRDQPFTTALQNLQLIFEKNRIKAPKAISSAAASEQLTAHFLSEITDLVHLDSYIVKLYGDY